MTALPGIPLVGASKHAAEVIRKATAAKDAAADDGKPDECPVRRPITAICLGMPSAVCVGCDGSVRCADSATYPAIHPAIHSAMY